MMSRVLFAAIVAAIVFVHGLALEKMHAMDGPDRKAPGAIVTNGD